MVQTRRQTLAKKEAGVPLSPPQSLSVPKKKAGSKRGEQKRTVIADPSSSSQNDVSSSTSNTTVHGDVEGYVFLRVLENPSRVEITEAFERGEAEGTHLRGTFVMRKTDFETFVKARATVQTAPASGTSAIGPNLDSVVVSDSETSSIASTITIEETPTVTVSLSRKNKASEPLERSSISKRRRIDTESPQPEDTTAPAETPKRAWRLTSMFGRVTEYLPGLRRQLPTILEASPNQDPPQPSQPITRSGKNKSRATKVSSTNSAQRRLLKEKRRLRIEKEAAVGNQGKADEKRIAEEIEGRVQERLKAHEAAEQAKPGQKRKGPSPVTIPNPNGCSYGMNLDYFGDSSGDEEALDDSPSLRAAKRPRLDMPAPSIPDHHDKPLTPPPRPTPSHAPLPSNNPHHALPSANSAAVEYARYAPKHPSYLRTAMRRLSSSPTASSSQTITGTPCGNWSGRILKKTNANYKPMIVGKDQLTDFDHSCPTGQDSTTNPKILARLDALCKPRLMERSRQVIEADMALFMAATAPHGVS